MSPELHDGEGIEVSAAEEKAVIEAIEEADRGDLIAADLLLAEFAAEQ